MVKTTLQLFFLLSLFILGACASKMTNQMKAYRDSYALGDLAKASELLKESELKKDKKSKLLWHFESGTLALAQENYDAAITDFQTSLELIDQLYTKKISAKAASFLINDASDVFYGASYERSYAHYFLAKAYYARYLKTKNKLDLQGSRATILAWDSYFAQLQRSAAPKTIYQTDLMLKIFGAEVHEVSEIRNDKQIALQLYKDALDVLNSMGGAFGVFNSKSADYIKEYEEALAQAAKPSQKAYVATSAKENLKHFIIYKILALTKAIRSTDFSQQVKALHPTPEILKKVNEAPANVVIVLEEGLIPQKVGKPFNFGLKGAVDSVESPGAKAFIATVGAEIITAFAMNTLGMRPESFQTTGSFIFAHDITRLAVQEAAISFELPMIEESPKLKDFDLLVLDSADKIVKQEPLAIVSENGSIAKVVLEEDVVARYIKTGTRVAVKHLVAIVAAMQVYQKLKENGEFIAKSAAMATYIASSKGIAAFEKADTRHWTTLPDAFRLSELLLPPGTYRVALSEHGKEGDSASRKILGSIVVNGSGKEIHLFKFITP
jgi:hypothetical protein